jgi:hypothetical protein
MSDQDDSTTADDQDDAATNSGDDGQDDNGTSTDDGADKLGDAGKQALDRMKVERNELRRERNALRDQLAAATKKDDKGTDTTDPAELRKQAQAEARAEVLNERALDKVETKAAKLFADPEDARALLASRVDDFVDDGKVDVEAIEKALADLLKKKPHLAAAKPARFQGGADGGARKESQVAQLTEQDLKKMSPEQIVEARKKGQLKDLLSGD